MPELQVESFEVGALTPYHRNPRRGDVTAIADSLRTHGQYRPIVVNLGTLTGRAMEVLAGNHTLAAAVSLEWPRIQATTVDVDDEGAARIVLADNRLADLGGYDDADLLEVLQAAGTLDGTGYTDRDLALLLRDLDDPVGLTDPDDVPAFEGDEPVSRLGDVWALGPHRLIVGDCGDAATVLEVLGGATIDCVWTDPPYGVDYQGLAGKVANDGTEDAASAVFAAACNTILAVARPGAPVYVAHAEQIRDRFLADLRASGLRYRQTLIWVKDTLVLSRGDYHYRHEPIIEAEWLPEGFDPISYAFVPAPGQGRLGRGGDHWFGDNKQTTVFNIPRPKASALHPTMKPTELIERMLRNSCRPGGLVFDPFAGSGSTMIACHRLGLRGILVELDQTYADVICRRWQEHTGIVPIRDGTEVSFS